MNFIDMENFLIYLLKASTGIMLFYLFYYLVLRKETFYVSNRLYLIAGLALAVILPAFPVSYTTPVALISNSDFFAINENPIGDFMISTTSESESLSFWNNPALILSSIYLLGAGFFLFRLVFQTAFVAIQLRHGKKMLLDGVTVINIKRQIMPFSFFNTVIINIKEYSKEELSNIIAHEKVHIQERHWVDLLIIELLTVVFWINPIVWLYEKSIKQNHEYLADQGVLLAGYHPGQYQALLINQLMGVKILGLTSNLNFSLNKKRMEMMKKDKSPRLKKVKLLIALPVIAVLIFAFAKPEYVMVDGIESSIPVQNALDKQEMISLKGTVKDDNGIPLTGANVILKNTMQGTVVDRKGEFEIDIPSDGTLVVSFIGYKTMATSVKSKDFVSIKMQKGLFDIKLPDVSGENVKMQAPPPPPKVSEADKGKVFTIVEEMPYYSNGGMTRFALDIQNEVASIMKKTGDRGEVLVGFTIDKNGSITNPLVVESANSEMLDASAVKVIQKLNNWNPGNQRGKKVPVNITVPVNFN
jgi:TonB family protein